MVTTPKLNMEDLKKKAADRGYSQNAISNIEKSSIAKSKELTAKGLQPKMGAVSGVSSPAVDYQKHIDFFGGADQYAAAIKSKEALGEKLQDSASADAFKKANPQYFQTAQPTPTISQPTQQDGPPIVEANTSTAGAGKYTDASGETKDILGYNDLPDDMKQLVDNMSDADRKMLDMQWGNDANAKLEYLRQVKRNQEYLTEQRQRGIEITDKEGNILQKQSSQRLQDAGRQVDNLMQQFGYLGSRGQPGKSGAALQAANRAITDAQQKFTEMKAIETQIAQIRELGIQMDTAKYEKQMADISDDLTMKVGSQIQNAMNEMSAADMAGRLDTIDGVTQFKRDLLAKLDANITGYTDGSMKQMQYVTEQYTKMAEDAQARLVEWEKNANTVNTDMSNALGYYVDGNGTPLYNSMGERIELPENPPMDPVWDKENGQLITFSLDENGQIVAKVQQVTAGGGDWEIKSVNGVDMWVNPKTRQTQPINEVLSSSTTPTGPTVEPVAQDKVQAALQQVEAQGDGSIGGQCGEFVNNYLQGMGLGRLFIDPIEAKKTVKNSDTPTVGSVAIFDWSNNPNATLAQQKYGHVGIVTAVNGDKITVKQSNNKGNEQVFTSTYNTKDAYGFFDPSKGLKPQEGGLVDTSNLSPLAKASYNSKSITSTGKSGDAVISELEKAGAFDSGEGNLNFYKASQTVKNEIPNVVEGYTEWKKAYDIIKNLESTGKLNSIVGPFDAKKVQAGLKTGIGGYGQDISQLNTILQKTLSQYMMKISGATVPDAEVARLQQQVPNLSQGEKQFLATVELYNTAMNSALDNVQTKFGFSSPEKVKEAVYGKSNNSSSTSTTNTTPLSQYKSR